MQLPEARDYIAATTPTNAPQDSFIHAAHVDLYNASSDADKAKLADAMEALLVGGADWEQQMAAAFFNTVGAAPAVIDDALAAYAKAPSAVLAELVSNSWFALTEPQAAAARALFVADPARHVALAAAAVAHDDGSGWAALMQLVATSNDAAALAAAFKAAYAAEREDDFYAAMKPRPPELVRATAALLSPASAPKLLAACNLGLN